MGPRWLQLCYFAEGHSPEANSTIAVTKWPLVLTQRLEWNRIYLFYIHHSYIHCLLIVFWLMYPACSMRAKQCVYSTSRVHCTQTRHHHANHLRASKDYLQVEKDYLRLWPSFFRIVSLILITWRTLKQSMYKSIWMPYIIVYSIQPSKPLFHPKWLWHEWSLLQGFPT